MAISLDTASVLTSYQDTASSLITANTSATVAVGGFIVLGISNRSNANTITVLNVSGGALNWTMVGNVVTGVNDRITMVYAPAPLGLASGTAITANYSGSATGGRGMVASSFLGINLGTPWSGSATTRTGTATTYSLSTTSVTNDSLIIATVSNWDSTATHTATTGTEAVEDHAQTIIYSIQTSTGTYSLAGTFSAALQDVELITSFNGQSGTPPDVPSINLTRSGVRGV
jgi:hypothetical protein